jgi:hypothetical protein
MTSNALLPVELQVVAALVLLAFLSRVLYLIRYHRLSLRDSLVWLLSTLAGLVMTLHPGALRWTADRLAIAIASNALFALAILYLALNLLSLTIATSNSASRVRRLTQECALLRAEIDALRARSRDDGDRVRPEAAP